MKRSTIVAVLVYGLAGLVFLGVTAQLVKMRCVSGSALLGLGGALYALAVFYERQHSVKLVPVRWGASAQMALGVLGILLGGCSSPAGADVDATQAAVDASESESFVGKWETIAGTMVGSCDNGDKINDSLVDQIDELRRGTGAELIRVEEGCTVRFSVMKSRAEALPGQVCQETGLRAEILEDIYTRVDDKTLNQKASVKLIVDSVVCNVTAQATLKKIL